MGREKPTWLPDRLLPLWESDERSVLRCTIVGEAARESPTGMFAVGCVIRNRVLLPWWWGKTYHEVCLMKWQFSCFWGVDWKKRRTAILRALEVPEKYPQADEAAGRVLAGEPDITDSATHYFNPKLVLPDWASSLVRTARIGGHDFYGHGF